MRLFLVAGKAGSGKSEVAKIIKEYYEKKQEKTVITEYSKYLKIFAKEMLDWDGNPDNKPRQFLQEMGLFIRENLKQKDLLINRMKTDMTVYEHFFKNVIISDVRYPEEIISMKEKYPQAISISVVNETEDSPLTIKQASHKTEHALDNYDGFDYVIHNEFLQNLKNDVYEILEGLE